jgi:hypothetical protein
MKGNYTSDGTDRDLDFKRRRSGVVSEWQYWILSLISQCSFCMCNCRKHSSPKILCLFSRRLDNSRLFIFPYKFEIKDIDLYKKFPY